MSRLLEILQKQRSQGINTPKSSISLPVSKVATEQITQPKKKGIIQGIYDALVYDPILKPIGTISKGTMGIASQLSKPSDKVLESAYNKKSKGGVLTNQEQKALDWEDKVLRADEMNGSFLRKEDENLIASNPIKAGLKQSASTGSMLLPFSKAGTTVSALGKTGNISKAGKVADALQKTTWGVKNTTPVAGAIGGYGATGIDANAGEEIMGTGIGAVTAFGGDKLFGALGKLLQKGGKGLEKSVMGVPSKGTKLRDVTQKDELSGKLYDILKKYNKKVGTRAGTVKNIKNIQNDLNTKVGTTVDEAANSFTKNGDELVMDIAKKVSEERPSALNSAGGKKAFDDLIGKVTTLTDETGGGKLNAKGLETLRKYLDEFAYRALDKSDGALIDRDFWGRTGRQIVSSDLKKNVPGYADIMQDLTPINRADSANVFKVMSDNARGINVPFLGKLPIIEPMAAGAAKAGRAVSTMGSEPVVKTTSQTFSKLLSDQVNPEKENINIPLNNEPKTWDSLMNEPRPTEEPPVFDSSVLGAQTSQNDQSEEDILNEVVNETYIDLVVAYANQSGPRGGRMGIEEAKERAMLDMWKEGYMVDPNSIFPSGEVEEQSAESQKSMNKLSTAEKIVTMLGTELNKMDLPDNWAEARFKGAQRGLATKGFGTDPDARSFENLRRSFSSMLARSLGEVGTLTDQDRQIAINMIPSYGSTKEEANRQLQDLLSYIESLKGVHGVSDEEMIQNYMMDNGLSN